VGVNIMSGPGSSTPSTTGEGESVVQVIPQLPEVVVEVTNWEGDYCKVDWDDDLDDTFGFEVARWKRVKAEVEGINRTNKYEDVMTAMVHVVVSDRPVS